MKTKSIDPSLPPQVVGLFPVAAIVGVAGSFNVILGFSAEVQLLMVIVSQSHKCSITSENTMISHEK